jgi:hypothetical protein
MELEDFENAVKSFELAVWEQPKNAEFRYHLGEAYANAEGSRRGYKQFKIAAKIGSKKISKRFTELAWEVYEQYPGSSELSNVSALAIVAHKKNAEAQFLYGQQLIRDDKIGGITFLRDALDWSGDEKIVNPMIKLIKENRYMLSPAFYSQITREEEPFEDYGPVVFSPIENEIIWSRADKGTMTREQKGRIVLCGRFINETETNELTMVNDPFTFPCCSNDSSLIYYSDGERIYQFHRMNKTTRRLNNGSYPDVSRNDSILCCHHNGNIFLADTSGNIIKMLTDRNRYEYNFIPKFVHPADSIIIFLSYRDNTLSFFKIDTTGKNEQLIANIDKYGFDRNRLYQYAYDVSPNGKNIIFSWDEELFQLNIQSGKANKIYVSGAYPSISPDGESLAILSRKYGDRGNIAIVNLPELYECNRSFENNEINRKKLLKYLQKAAECMEKPEVRLD